MYLFTTDKNVKKGTFGVFKMDFTSSIPKYVYTTLTMGYGSYFRVSTISRTSLTDANDFYFAGKAIYLTDGIITKT